MCVLLKCDIISVFRALALKIALKQKEEVLMRLIQLHIVRLFLGILPVTVMLMVLLLCLFLDSHQYTPLSPTFTVLTLQVEDVSVPQSDPHLDSLKLGTHHLSLSGIHT